MDYDSKIVSLHVLLIRRSFSRCSCRGRCRFLRRRPESLRGCTKEQEGKEAIRCGQQFHILSKSLSKRQLSILVAGRGRRWMCRQRSCVAAKNDRQTGRDHASRANQHKQENNEDNENESGRRFHEAQCKGFIQRMSKAFAARTLT